MRLFFFLLMAGLAFSAAAQNTEEETIRKTIDLLFTSMKAGDSLLARTCFDENARLQTALIARTKKPVLNTEPLDSFLVQVAAIKHKKHEVEERITSCEIRVDLPMASAWATYEFYVNGKLAHTGVDAFQLFKSESGWKIIQLCDTRKKAP